MGGSSGLPVYPPFAAPPVRGRGTPAVREGAADPPPEDDYPAIEQFLDEFPSIEDYLADPGESTQSQLAPTPGSPAAALPVATANPADQGTTRLLDDEGWAVTEWQSYDWSKLSLLGRASR